MQKTNIYGIYWFFALAPFVTAVPLYFLMPDTIPARVYAFAFVQSTGPRWQIFLLPLSWFVAEVILHVFFWLLERTYEHLPLGLVVPRMLIVVIFCGLAIAMELMLYRASMLVLSSVALPPAIVL